MESDDVEKNIQESSDKNSAEHRDKDISVSIQNESKISGGVLIGMIICVILAIGGIGVGVWAMMDGNAKEARINNDINELRQQVEDLKNKKNDDDDYVYGKPDFANEIDSISVTYNGDNNDVVDIFDGEIYYYTFNADDTELVPIEESENVIETDTAEIMEYVFDNIDYLTEDETLIINDWSIEVNSGNKFCMISGAGEYPEWFKELLNKLNVSEYGNYSKKNV